MMQRVRRPTVTLAGSDAVERRVRALEDKRPLDLEQVERIVRRLHRPDVLADRLGDAIRYSQRVEADVAGLSIDVLLPHAESDHVGRFLTVWVPDELGHAKAQAVLLAELGLATYTPQPADAVPLHNRVAGLLGRILPRAKEIVAMSYHTIGAINERLAMGAYARMAEITAELGEDELGRTLLEPMRRDESAHLGYYRTYARQLRAHLAPWQQTVVRSLIVRTYAPVGAGRRADRPLFGKALIALEDDPENPDISRAVDGIARDLLATHGRSLPSFVLGAMRECVAAARVG